MTYIRPASSQINLWPSLGLDLNWNELFASSKKSEDFQTPSANLTALGATFNPSAHGFNGPLTTCFSPHILSDNSHEIFNETFKAMGIPPRHEFDGGELRGFGVQAVTQDPHADVREDAARAYYYPVMNRTNLAVFVNTTATRILWSSSQASGAKAVAVGAEVVNQTGQASTIFADREVILSAGAIRSPALLEFSGVGNPSILSNSSIPVKVALPGVGENFQDQTTMSVVADTTRTRNFTGLPGFVAHTSLQDLFNGSEAETAAFYNASLAALPDYAAFIAAHNGGATNASVQARLLRTQLDLLYDSNTPTMEIAPLGLVNLVGVVFWPLQPFSRGSVHINATAGPTGTPLIDGRFFSAPIDATLAVRSLRFAREYVLTPPFSSLVNMSTLTPSPALLPASAPDSEWFDWIKVNASYQPNYHHLGTCAMLPRDLGGVVDNNFTVYGTANVRVVDLSTIPFQVAGHSTSLLYGVAEWAVGKIKMAM